MWVRTFWVGKKLGTKILGTKKNWVRKEILVRKKNGNEIFWGVRGSSTRGVPIKSKQNYILGFLSVTAFEVPPCSFVSGSC